MLLYCHHNHEGNKEHFKNCVKFYMAFQDFTDLRARFYVMEPCNYIIRRPFGTACHSTSSI